MNDVGNNYEVQNIRGEYDIEYSYGYSNSELGKDLDTCTNSKLLDMYNFWKYRYRFNIWSFRTFMKEYVIITREDLVLGKHICYCGFMTEHTKKIEDCSFILKDNILYIEPGQFMDDNSRIIVHPKGGIPEITVMSINNKPKQYVGEPIAIAGDESFLIVTGYFNDNKLETPVDIEVLRRRDSIVETFSYYNINVLINHDVNGGRFIFIAEYDIDNLDKIFYQYAITNDEIRLVTGSRDADTSYIQYIDNKLYIFLDNDAIKDTIEVTDGFRDKIIIEKVTKLFTV